MKEKEIVCIICPNGCELNVEYENGEVINLEGALCKRGGEYAEKELFEPERTLTTSVFVNNGDLPLVSVRTNRPVPKEKIGELMELIDNIKLEAPVNVGETIIANPLGLECEIKATRKVDRH